MNTTLLGFRCLTCGHTYTPAEVVYTCPTDGGNLDAVYDYARIVREVDPRTIATSPDRSIWHYAPLLPTTPPSPLSTLPSPLSSLGWSPLYRAPILEKDLNVRAIWLKDDSRLPSSSFKDRASAMVIARALEMGVETICVASTGNAAAALSTLCACAGTNLRAVIFVPDSTPEGKLAGILIHGATVFMVRGSYTDAVAMADAACRKFGWYNRSTGVNPFTREGKKTAGFEIAEQLATARHGDKETRRYGERIDSVSKSPGQLVSVSGFRSPDVVIVPVGDGNILSGVHKGFYNLHQLGWIDKLPRFIGVTATLAPSLFHAWRDGVETFANVPSTTIASGISVDIPCDGVAALRAIRGTGGTIIEATDDEMLDAMRVLAAKAGVFVEPACAAAHVGLWKARQRGLIGADDEVVLQLTGSGLKDTKSALKAAGKPIIVESLVDVAIGK
jgi:threonine synthase